VTEEDRRGQENANPAQTDFPCYDLIILSGRTRFCGMSPSSSKMICENNCKPDLLEGGGSLARPEKIPTHGSYTPISDRLHAMLSNPAIYF
jgi:hypothetical protein